MTRHHLKIAPVHFAAWLDGEKTCELRKDDRIPRFEARDELVLHEHSPWIIPSEPSSEPRELTVRVLSVLRDHEGLAPGYCLMSCEEVKA